MRVFARFCKRLLSLKGSLTRATARQWAASRGVSVKVQWSSRRLAAARRARLSRLCFAVGSCVCAESHAGGKDKISGERLCPLPSGLLLPLFAQPSFAMKSLVGSDVKGNHSTCKETMHESEVRSPLHPRAR